MVRSRLVRTLTLGMLAVSITVLGACAALGAESSALQGEWVLASGSDAAGSFIDPVQPITLEFEGNTVSGQAPCNPYSGQIERGPGATGTGPIEFGALTRTEMGCAEIEQNLLESRFFAAIEAVDRVAVSADGDRLELTGDGIFVSFERSDNREG